MTLCQPNLVDETHSCLPPLPHRIFAGRDLPAELRFRIRQGQYIDPGQPRAARCRFARTVGEQSRIRAATVSHSWTAAGGTVSVAGLNGSAAAAPLPYNTAASLEQTSAASRRILPRIVLPDRGQRGAGIPLATGRRDFHRIDLRTATSGALQANLPGEWTALQRLTDNAGFNVPANQTVRFRVTGRNFGAPAASYDIVWSDPDRPRLVHAATQITKFASSGVPAAPPAVVRFVRDITSANSFIVDDVTLLADAAAAPVADYLSRCRPSSPARSRFPASIRTSP